MEPMADVARRSSSSSVAVKEPPVQTQGRKMENVDENVPFDGISENIPEVKFLLNAFREA